MSFSRQHLLWELLNWFYYMRLFSNCQPPFSVLFAEKICSSRARPRRGKASGLGLGRGYFLQKARDPTVFFAKDRV